MVHEKMEPVLRVVVPVAVNTPGLLPGASLPPSFALRADSAFNVTLPVIVPEPPSVAPKATVTAVVAKASAASPISSVPALTAVAPV